MKRKLLHSCICLAAFALVTFSALIPARAERIRDAARLANEVPNQLQGMGLVLGLDGTGDGGDYLPAMKMLAEMMKHFDNPITNENELKNAKNVAIVNVTCSVPPQGAHSGEKLEVKVNSIGAAKSLKGGRLFFAPLFAPMPDRKLVLGWASGDCIVDDDKHPTTATVHNGGVLTKNILPNEIQNGQFTLVLHTENATMENASAMADQINEDVSAQTGGKPAAIAVDATSVNVTIPKAELANPTAFIARIRNLSLPNTPEPAKVRIDTKTKTIVFTDEVELAPTTISVGVLTIDIAAPPAIAADGTSDPSQLGNAKLKDLMEAFKVFRVSPDERIEIIKQLHKANVLKAELEID